MIFFIRGKKTGLVTFVRTGSHIEHKLRNLQQYSPDELEVVACISLPEHFPKIRLSETQVYLRLCKQFIFNKKFGGWIQPNIMMNNMIEKYAIEKFTVAQAFKENTKKLVENALRRAASGAAKPLKTKEIKVFEKVLPEWYDKEGTDDC